MVLKCPLIGWVFHSTYTSHSRRVSILIAKSLHFELRRAVLYPQGRYFFMPQYMESPSCCQHFMYLHRSAPLYSQRGSRLWLIILPVQTIWLGDFSTTLNPNLDKSHLHMLPQPIAPNTRFSRLIGNFNLVDTWRHKYPSTRAQLCFFSTHNSMSHTDFILVTNALLPQLMEAAFCPRLLSDHRPYWMSIPTIDHLARGV